MEEENKSVDFELLEHQEEAVEGVDKIYANGNRFAGAKVPTGGGKSFIAMNQILKAGRNDYLSKTNDNPPVNEAAILYIAPTNEILFQTQRNIAEFILKKPVDGIEKDGKIIISPMNKDEIINVVKHAFPNLSLKCYQTLISEMENRKLENQDYDFIILDEAHRSGAPKSQHAVAELLGCKVKNGEPVFDSETKKKSKVLAITATPERDVDGKNMMDLWAKALDNLSEEQIENKEHLGIDLDLDTAVRKGIVVEPEVIHFNANLVDTPEYKRLVELYNSAQGKIKENLGKRLDRVNREVIGINDYHTLSPEQQEEAKFHKNMEVIIKAIQDGKIEKKGKMILFIPHNVEKNGQKLEITEFFEEKEKIIRKMLENSGLDIEVKVLSSHFKDEENTTSLNSFNQKVEKENGFKIIMASEKLNEGIHAKGITNSFMMRNISEGENTNQRAQTILFLQQIGRTIFSIIPGEEEKKRPVILDWSNNFYTQNRDNPRQDRIDIFKLTDEQKILLEEYRLATLEVYKSSGPIQKRLPRLMETLQILGQYRFGPNNDIEFKPNLNSITIGMTLEKLLDTPPLCEKKDEILQRLKKEYLYIPNKKYYIGSDFCYAQKAFWKGTKFFENYSLEEIVKYGIIDTKNDDLKEYVKNSYVDLETGFIKMGVASKFIGLNIYTGREVDKDGRDMEGKYLGEFDEEGYSINDGYNKYGFDRNGINKFTKTIHDIHGFMDDRKNIQTGDEFDLLGYNIDGIKPVWELKEIPGEITKQKNILGGWDREGFWHIIKDDGTFSGPISKYSEGIEPKVDVHGFYSHNKKHSKTGEEINVDGFYKMGDCINPYREGIGKVNKFYNAEGFDIDGFDKDGFNIFRVHKLTGTRLNLEGKTAEMYNKTSRKIVEILEKNSDETKEKVFKLHKDGKFHYKKGDKEFIRKYDKRGFDGNGIHYITGTYKDIYGFTMIDYYLSKESIDKKYPGFKPKDVIKTVADKENNDFYKKVQDPIRPFKECEVNILGTDKCGNTADGKKHKSLLITSDYINKCMKNGMSISEYLIEYAKEEQLLVPEAKREIMIAFNQAAILYRICPELRELEKTKENAKIFYNAPEKKVKEFIDFCPELRSDIIKDSKIYADILAKIENELKKLNSKRTRTIEELSSKYKEEEVLEKQKKEISKRFEELKKISGLEI